MLYLRTHIQIECFLICRLQIHALEHMKKADVDKEKIRTRPISIDGSPYAITHMKINGLMIKVH